MTDAAKPIAAVFVHGIFSSGDVWKNLIGLLASDEALAGYTSFVTFTYPSPAVSLSLLERIPDLADLGQRLDGFLTTTEETKRARSIVLIGHSQGGLVIQQFLANHLRSSRAPALERIAQCVFLATPTNGSELLLSLRVKVGRIGLWHHPQESTLRPLNKTIGELQQTILSQAVYAAGTSEGQWPIRIAAYAGLEDGVVTSQSAQWVFKERGMLPGTHSTIVTPAGRDAPLVRVLTDVLARARHHCRPDVEQIDTTQVTPLDGPLFEDAVALHRDSGSAALSARREDIEYWLSRYESRFGIRLRVFAARHNTKVVGFLMFHADSARNLIVVDYLRRGLKEPIGEYLMGKLIDRLREAARTYDITRILFEVRTPAPGAAGRHDAALVRLWGRYGAKVISGVSYETLDMDRFPKPGSTEPHLLMYLPTGDPPSALDRSEVEEFVTYLYGTWFYNWLSYRWADQLPELKKALDDLTARVIATIPPGAKTLPVLDARDAR